MKKKGMGALAVWMVLLVGGLACTFGFGWKPLLGLDLQGGLSATLIPKDGTHPSQDAVTEASNIIRRRVDGLGIAEPEVMRSGKTVVVQLPGLKSRADQERAKKIIGTTAKLQFHQVLADLGPATTPSTTTKGTPTTTKGKSTATTTPGATTARGSTAPGTSAPAPTAQASGSKPTSKGAPTQHRRGVTPIAYDASHATTAPATTAPPTTVGGPTTTGGPTTSGAPTTTLSPQAQLKAFMAQHPGAKIYSGDGGRYLLGPVLFDGTVLSSAEAQLNTQTSQWEVNVKVKGADKTKVNKAFNECFAGKQNCPPIRQGDSQSGGGQRGAIAMVLDGKVISAPTVNAVNLPKNPNGFVITGNFNHKSADALALQLRYGALPVEFQPATLETVSATLGSSSLHAGIVAGLVGLGLVALYMLVFYRLLGLVAILSLATSTGVLWTVISYLGAHNGLALTLAGVTGIIVSIGVAVDSNVVFYEHLREDMTKGRTLRGTVQTSFGVAWKTIVSADFVSLIGAVILYLLTVGSVRGFAFYLGLSTLIDLLASWFFMRPLVYWMASRPAFNKRPGLMGVRAHHAGATSVSGPVVTEAGT